MSVLKKINEAVETFSVRVTKWAGSTLALLISIVLIAGWLLTGPAFDYSDTWQLVANTVTTIISFVMIFILQRAQNKDTDSLHVKLDNLLDTLTKKGADRARDSHPPGA